MGCPLNCWGSLRRSTRMGTLTYPNQLHFRQDSWASHAKLPRDWGLYGHLCIQFHLCRRFHAPEMPDLLEAGNHPAIAVGVPIKASKTKVISALAAASSRPACRWVFRGSETGLILTFFVISLLQSRLWSELVQRMLRWLGYAVRRTDDELERNPLLLTPHCTWRRRTGGQRHTRNNSLWTVGLRLSTMEKGLGENLRKVHAGLQSLGVGPLTETWSIPGTEVNSSICLLNTTPFALISW